VCNDGKEKSCKAKKLYTKEPCLATKETPIIRVTLKNRNKGKKQNKKEPVGQKRREEKYTVYEKSHLAKLYRIF